jgi:hypothetical protein
MKNLEKLLILAVFRVEIAIFDLNQVENPSVHLKIAVDPFAIIQLT